VHLQRSADPPNNQPDNTSIYGIASSFNTNDALVDGTGYGEWLRCFNLKRDGL
jgi:hypothetical protein